MSDIFLKNTTAKPLEVADILVDPAEVAKWFTFIAPKAKPKLILRKSPPKTKKYVVPPDLETNGCFGYVNGHLLLGHHHHQAIMAELIANGWTWEDLMLAEQIWGWYGIDFIDGGTVSLNFVSDAATMNESAAEGCREAFKKLYKVAKVWGSWENNGGDVKERHNLNYGGDYDRHYGNVAIEDLPRHVNKKATPIPPPPTRTND